MPLLEVIHADAKPLEVEQKRAFAKEVETILHEVIGTQPGRMRLVFLELDDDSHGAGLLEDD
jgi:phenylpyruvate tautomerase PptA (4-oxalocrotonate tautomerase family)